jgi:hypothetical protein
MQVAGGPHKRRGVYWTLGGKTHQTSTVEALLCWDEAQVFFRDTNTWANRI